MWCVMFHSKRVEPMCREVCGARGTTKQLWPLRSGHWAVYARRSLAPSPVRDEGKSGVHGASPASRISS